MISVLSYLANAFMMPIITLRNSVPRVNIHITNVTMQ